MVTTRRLTIAVVAVASALALTACGVSEVERSDAGDGPDANAVAPSVGSAYPGPVGAGEGRLRVLAWPGLAEDGSVDPAADWVTTFEIATGCQVDVTLFGTSDEAVARMQRGGVDVVSAPGDVARRLIQDGKVQPVNVDLVPNYVDVFADLKGTPHSTIDGVVYGVPHGRGANLVVWNRERVDGTVDSWSILFEPDSPAAGGVGPYDSPMTIADAAVYLMATRSDLGITDPYSLDREQFDAAIALLEQQRDLVSQYWSDPLAQADAIRAGSMTAATSRQAIVSTLDPTLVGSTVPGEGTTGWSDTWMIARDTPNVDCAYRWLDWIISPEVNAQAAEWIGEAPVSRRACARTVDRDHCDIHHADDAAYWSNVHYWTTPTEECLDGRTDVMCVPYDEWARAWADLRAG